MNFYKLNHTLPFLIGIYCAIFLSSPILVLSKSAKKTKQTKQNLSYFSWSQGRLGNQMKKQIWVLFLK